MAELAESAKQGSEAILLQALRAGDGQAYGELIRTYGPPIRATAMRLLRDEAEAHDAVQETFLSAFRSVARFEGKSQIGTWLHRIAVNAVLMRLRSKARRPEVSIHDLLPKFTDGGQHEVHQRPFADLPDQLAAREESCELVHECIQKLPENYRNALLLKDIEEMEYAEVARALGLTLNATRIRIHRARQALKALLEPHFGAHQG